MSIITPPIGTTPIDGGADGDTIISQEGSTAGSGETINGNSGNDVIFGDSNTVFVDTAAGNNSTANAIFINDSAFWSTSENATVGDTSVPYATIVGQGAGEIDYFAVFVGTGQTITIDVDFAGGGLGGGSFDSVVRLYDGLGEIAMDDDNDANLDPSIDGAGSFSGLDSLLQYTWIGPARNLWFSIEAFQNNPIPVGANYIINVSVTGHDATGAPVADNDTINGGNDTDVLFGGGGNDTLSGNNGISVLYGGSGNDTLTGEGFHDGGLGNDTMSGVGSSTLSYATYAPMAGTAGITIDLGLSTQQDTNGAGFDTILGNWDIFQGSRFDDTITTEDDFLNIDALDGNDIITLGSGNFFASPAFYDGGAGNDTFQQIRTINNLTLRGGEGNDTFVYSNFSESDLNFLIDGGADSDTLDLSAMSSNVTVNLVTGLLQTSGNNQANLAGIENIIAGTNSGFNTFIGNTQANTFIGGDGAEIFEGGLGADTLNGGGGTNDTASYENSASGVNVSLIANTASGGDAEGDVLSNIEYLIGSAQGDTLVGGFGSNRLTGGGGADMLYDFGDGDDVFFGGDGDDVFIGGVGADEFNGEGDTDTVRYANSALGVSVDLAGSATGGDAQGDTFSSIENLVGSQAGDTLSGDSQNNRLEGLGGDDRIEGRAGNDVLIGGANGAAGDTAVYSVGIEGGYTFGINNDGSVSVSNIPEFLGTDTLTGFENIEFFGSTFTLRAGNNGANDLAGGGQNDLFIAGGGNDIMTDTAGGDDYFFAGDGDDLIRSGIGADYIDGGANTMAGDTVSYANSNAGIQVQLEDQFGAFFGSGGTAEGDLLFGIENIIGSNFGDNLFGNVENNHIQGGTGDDVLTGFAGNDILDGGANGASGDRAQYLTTNRSDFMISDFVSDNTVTITNLLTGDVDTLINIEWIDFSDMSVALRVGTNGAETLVGDNFEENVLIGGGNPDYLLSLSNTPDILRGGGGNDQLQGSGGGDDYFGGDGIDEVRYNNSDAPVTVDLLLRDASGGHAEGDTFESIENVVGSGFGDTLRAGSSGSRIDGGGGDDTITAWTGIDFLIGGAGVDTLEVIQTLSIDTGFGFGTNTINGIFVRLGGGQLYGQTLDGDTALLFENVIATPYNDWIVGTNDNNTLNGSSGNDWLLDLGGDDNLIGGIGDDWLQGGEGADVNNGGANIDRVRYTQSDAPIEINLQLNIGRGGHAEGDTFIGIEQVTGSYGFGDYIVGDVNDNLIEGLTGNDRISGGILSEDFDLLSGGLGFDIFEFASDRWGVDVLLDYEDGIDRIDLTGSGLTLASFTQVDTDYGLRLDYNNVVFGIQSILIAGLDAGDITQADFF